MSCTATTLGDVDWSAHVLEGDLGAAVGSLKSTVHGTIQTRGVTLALPLANLGLVDEYDFALQPVVAGHGPSPLAGLHERIDLQLTSEHELTSGAVALRYRTR